MKIVNCKNLRKSTRWSPNSTTTEDIEMRIALSESLQDNALELKKKQEFEEKAQKYLSQQSSPLVLIEVEPDGNCLYYAIIESMIAAKFINIADFNLKCLAADLRNRTTFTMRHRSGEFLHMYDCMYKAKYDKISTVAKYANKSFMEYVEDQEKDGIYADEIAISIVAQMYRINIQVLSSDAKLQLFPAEKNSQQSQPSRELAVRQGRNTTITIVNRESKHFYGTKRIEPEELPPKFPQQMPTTGEVNTGTKGSPAETEFVHRINTYVRTQL
jgi:hypothetical protein